MWLILISAWISRPTMSAWPRSAARINPVPLKESFESTSAPRSQREIQQFPVALAGGDEVRALYGVVLGVDIGTLIDQGSGPTKVVLPGGGNELLVERGLFLSIRLWPRRRYRFLRRRAAGWDR